jgi:hypothetical protein
LSQELQLTFETVREEVEAQSRQMREANRYNEKPPAPEPDADERTKPAVSGAGAPLGVFRAEQFLLRLILEKPEFRAEIQEKLGADFWLLPEHRFLAEAAGTYSDDEMYARSQKRLAEIYSLAVDLTKAQDLLADCIAAICGEREKRTTAELQTEMMKLEKNGDLGGALAIMQIIQQRLQEKAT